MQMITESLYKKDVTKMSLLSIEGSKVCTYGPERHGIV